ncbi:MAG: AI-2E family transporter [Gammaproteobacteria bacterium AqS3]|nr:AI-2E family transporter [Gammaproteobacteria bacterium AqS3]
MGARLAGIVIVLALLAGALYVFSPVLELLVLAFFLAYIGQPLIARLGKWGVPHAAATALALLLLLLLLSLGVGMAIPVVAVQLQQLGALLPAFSQWVNDVLLPQLVEWGVPLGQSDADVDVLVGMLSDSVASLGQMLAGFTANLYSSGTALLVFLLKLSLFPVISYYLMREYDWIGSNGAELLPPSLRDRVVPAVRECDEVLGGFVIGQLSMMGMLAFYYVFTLWLCGLDQALSIGILIGLLSFIPFVGTALGLVLVLISTALQFGEWLPVLLVMAVFAGGQLLENLVLAPWLVGNRLGLHPVAVLLGLLIAGHLFGFLGILLALPLTAISVVALRHLIEAYKSSSYYA